MADADLDGRRAVRCSLRCRLPSHAARSTQSDRWRCGDERGPANSATATKRGAGLGTRGEQRNSGRIASSRPASQQQRVFEPGRARAGPAAGIAMNMMKDGRWIQGMTYRRPTCPALLRPLQSSPTPARNKMAGALQRGERMRQC